MKVEIISVGTELLLGDILNTNARYLSRELANLGVNIYRQVTVGDNIARLEKALAEAFQEADIVLVTGGLGPTQDDITKEGCAKYFGQKLVLNQRVWEDIQEICAKFSRGRENIPPNNIRQAMFPENAQIIENPNGTAPGAVFEKDGKKIVLMPGPPGEMIPMFRDSIRDLVFTDRNRILKSEYIRFFGIGESKLEIEIKDILDAQTNPTVALYAKEGEVMIRVSAMAESEAECRNLIKKTVDIIKTRVGQYIYLTGGEEISSSQSEMNNVVAKLLVDTKHTISVAESCTGGMISSQLVEYPGISSSFLEGCVTYSNEAKQKRLGVKKETLDRYGAVSSQTAEEMARGVAESLGSDIGLSTTGIAGPDGGSDEKPVGLVYIGLYFKGETSYRKCLFTGNRQKIRTRAAREALNMVRLLLLENKNKF